MITEFERNDLEHQISRLGCDFKNVGAVCCIVIVDSEDSVDGIKLADDQAETIDLKVTETLARLRQLPDNAGVEEFWRNIVDSDWSVALQQNGFMPCPE